MMSESQEVIVIVCRSVFVVKMEKIKNLAIVSESVNNHVGVLASNTEELKAVIRSINETTERIRESLPRLISMEVQFDNEDKTLAVL